MRTKDQPQKPRQAKAAGKGKDARRGGSGSQKRAARLARVLSGRQDESAPPSPLEAAWFRLLRAHPAEAKRWQQEAKREARRHHDEFPTEMPDRIVPQDDWARKAEARIDARTALAAVPPGVSAGDARDALSRLEEESPHSEHSALPRPRKRTRKRVPRPALQRGFATLKADPRFSRWRADLAGCAFHPDVGPSLEHLSPAALAAAQYPWHAVANARFVVAVLTRAEEFYRALRAAYPVRADLECDLASWPPWTNAEAVLALHARIRFEVDGTLAEDSRKLAAQVQRMVTTHAPVPKRLRAAWNVADLIPADTRMLDLPRERGRNGGLGGWPGFVRAEISIAGHRAQTLRSLAEHPTKGARVSKVDLVSPRLLTSLYGPGQRCGPRAAAQEAIAELVGRSRQQVEKLAAAVRAQGEIPDAAK